MTTRIDTASIGHADFERYADNRSAIYAEITAERRDQDKIWGGEAHDDTVDEESWISYIVEYAQVDRQYAGRDFRTRMMQVAALAVAAIESHDRKAKKESS